MKQQDISLKTENTELGKKLTEYQSRINEMQSQLYDVQQSSDEMASTMYNHVENLQKEVTESELMLGQEWNSTIVQIIEAVGKLDDDSLGYVEESEISVQDKGKLLNPINPNTFKTLIEQLSILLVEISQLESACNKLSSELMSRMKEIEELNKKKEVI